MHEPEPHISKLSSRHQHLIDNQRSDGKGNTYDHSGTTVATATAKAAEIMDPSVSHVSGGASVAKDPSVRDKNSFAFASSSSPTSPGGHHQLQPGDGLDESRVALVASAVQLGDEPLNGLCRLSTPVS